MRLVAEDRQVDLAGMKGDFRRTDQTAGRVDKPHGGKRRGGAGQIRPDAKMFQHCNGTVKKRRGASGRKACRRRKERGLKPRPCRRQRGGIAGSAATNDGYFIVSVFADGWPVSRDEFTVLISAY